MKYIAILFIFSFVPTWSSAGSVNGATITKVEMGPRYGTNIFIEVKPEPPGPPTCSKDEDFSFVFSSTAPMGKELLAAVLLAKSTGQKVAITGTGECGGHTNEVVHFLRLE